MTKSKKLKTVLLIFLVISILISSWFIYRFSISSPGTDIPPNINDKEDDKEKEEEKHDYDTPIIKPEEFYNSIVNYEENYIDDLEFIRLFINSFLNQSSGYKWTEELSIFVSKKNNIVTILTIFNEEYVSEYSYFIS